MKRKREKMQKFMIPEGDRGLFKNLDHARISISALEDILRRYKDEEKVLAAAVFAKYGIPVNQVVSFRNWLVTHVGGQELPDPPKSAESSEPDKALPSLSSDPK